jgi:AraC-like DNA-binding protein
VDSRALFQRAGLDVEALRDPDARYPLEATTRLWRLAVEATSDPALGLEVARHTHPTTFHALGFSLAASGTLREAFERTARFFRLVTDAAQLAVSSTERELRLDVFLEQGAAPAAEAVDAFMAVCVRMCRALAGRELNPIAVLMRRPAPTDPAPYRRYFRVMPSFGAAVDALVFDARRCDEPLPTANAELARVNEAVIARHLADLDTPDLRAQVRRYLVEVLPRGEPSQEAAARKLGLSLRRRLSSEATSYTRILDEVRKELALSYLNDPRYTLGEITYLLGFAEHSNFSRSFKRWQGVSPREYRAGRRGA